MGNIEASIKTYNRMADHVRRTKVEMMSMTACADNVEMVYDLITSALQTANMKIDEFIASLYGIPKAFKVVNSAFSQPAMILNNAENNFKSIEEKLVSTQSRMNQLSTENAFKSTNKLAQNVKGTIKTAREDSFQLAPNVETTYIEKTKEKNRQFQRPNEKGIENKAVRVSTKNFKSANTGIDINNVIHQTSNEMVKLSNMWCHVVEKMADSLSLKLTPDLDTKQLETTLAKARKKMMSVDIRTISLQKRMSTLNTEKATMQISEFAKESKNTTEIGSKLKPFSMQSTINSSAITTNNPQNDSPISESKDTGNKISNRLFKSYHTAEKIMKSVQKSFVKRVLDKAIQLQKTASNTVYKANAQNGHSEKTENHAKQTKQQGIGQKITGGASKVFNSVSNGLENVKKMAAGLSVGFNIVSKGIGTVKDVLNQLAPDRMAKLSGMWNNTFSAMMANVAVKLNPTFDKLEQFMLSPAFRTFMNNIETALTCLITAFEYILGLAEPLTENINQAFSFILENSGTITAMLMAIATAIAILTLGMILYSAITKIQGTVASIAAGENAKLNAIMAMNPAIFIVGAIIALILILLTLIATVKPVREAFARLAESFISFAENGINRFLEALAGLAEGILNFAGGAINAFLNMFVNPFIDGINKIIHASNKIFGTDFKQLEHFSVDFSSKAESISESILSKRVNFSDAKKAVGEGIRNFDANKIKSKITGAFELGSEKAGVNLNKQSHYVQPSTATTGLQTSDHVSMQDQDMQMLREVAERESINSYTTMTPSVKIDVGSINENADAEKIIQEIVNRIIQEMEASAKGVVMA